MMDLMVGAGTVMSTRRLTEELSRRWGIPADHLGRDTTDATTDDVVIEDVWADSGSVTPGSLFACVPGRLSSACNPVGPTNDTRMATAETAASPNNEFRAWTKLSSMSRT